MRTIPMKEDLIIEFKSDIKGYPDSELIDEIVGMTNTKGGILYLGVEDDGTITGVSKKHNDAIGVMALIANSTIPSVSTRAEIINEENKDVLKINIPMSRTVISTASGKMLRRRLKADGSPEVVPMYSYEISTRLSELALLDFSASPLPGATLDDFDPVQRSNLRNKIKTLPGGEKNLLTLSDEEIDKALRLTTDIEGVTYPTVTGMLILGKEEKIAELMPTVRAEFQVLEGTKVRMNIETHAPLLDVLDKFETYMISWNPEREIEHGMYRIAVPEFDKAAFREGLVNAFSHRAYTELGAVRVLIDDEGLTISSPGGFIDGVSFDNLLTVEPHGKNPALADALKRIGLAEKTGRGIDRIYEGSIQYGRPWPDYSETTSRNVKLFLRRSKADVRFTTLLAEEQKRIGRPFSIISLMIMSLLKDGEALTEKCIVERTRFSKEKIKGAIEKLLDIGMIECSEYSRVKAYRLKIGNAVHDNGIHIGMVEERFEESVSIKEKLMNLAMRQGGIITKQDAGKCLRMNPDKAYLEIKKLVNEGVFYKYNGGKYTKYKLV